MEKDSKIKTTNQSAERANLDPHNQSYSGATQVCSSDRDDIECVMSELKIRGKAFKAFLKFKDLLDKKQAADINVIDVDKEIIKVEEMRKKAVAAEHSYIEKFVEATDKELVNSLLESMRIEHYKILNSQSKLAVLMEEKALLERSKEERTKMYQDYLKMDSDFKGSADALFRVDSNAK